VLLKQIPSVGWTAYWSDRVTFIRLLYDEVPLGKNRTGSCPDFVSMFLTATLGKLCNPAFSIIGGYDSRVGPFIAPNKTCPVALKTPVRRLPIEFQGYRVLITSTRNPRLPADEYLDPFPALLKYPLIPSNSFPPYVIQGFNCRRAYGGTPSQFGFHIPRRVGT
jgi:hypothetical protein